MATLNTLTFLRFKVTQVATGGIVTLAPDPLSQVTDPLELPLYLDTVAENSAFSISLAIEGVFLDETEAEVTLPVDGFLATTISPTVNGITVTTQGNVITVTGQYISPFPGSFYSFAMPGNTVRQLPVDTTEPFLRLVQYKMPGVVEMLFSITTPAIFNDAAAPSLELKQWVVWRFQPAASTLQSLVSKRT